MKTRIIILSTIILSIIGCSDDRVGGAATGEEAVAAEEEAVEEEKQANLKNSKTPTRTSNNINNGNVLPKKSNIYIESDYGETYESFIEGYKKRKPNFFNYFIVDNLFFGGCLGSYQIIDTRTGNVYNCPFKESWGTELTLDAVFNIEDNSFTVIIDDCGMGEWSDTLFSYWDDNQKVFKDLTNGDIFNCLVDNEIENKVSDSQYSGIICNHEYCEYYQPFDWGEFPKFIKTFSGTLVTVCDYESGFAIEQWKINNGTGERLLWHKNGKISERREYENGEMSGEVDRFYPNGQLAFKYFMKYSFPSSGVYLYYWPDGSLIRKEYHTVDFVKYKGRSMPSGKSPPFKCVPYYNYFEIDDQSTEMGRFFDQTKELIGPYGGEEIYNPNYRNKK
jgi:hypothetical protein